MTKIAVIFGGPTPEHDISILSGLQAGHELMASGHETAGLYWSKTGEWFLVDPKLEGSAFLEGIPRSAEPVLLVAGGFAGAASVSQRGSAGMQRGGFVRTKGLLGKYKPLEIDVAVVCCHGAPGEDGSLQGALDLAGVPYAGPDVAGAALGMDKLAFGAVMADAGLPTLPRVLLSKTGEVPFEGPYIVKPRFGGSSIGIEIVDSVDTARALLRTSPHLRAGAVVEPYRPDSFDIQVAVRRFPEPQTSAIEKPVRAPTSGAGGAKIYGYADKYVGGEGMVSAPRELPADLPQTSADHIRAMALTVAELVGVRGVQRIDFLSDGGDYYVNEINTIPGSLAKYLWIEPEISFATLLGDMIAEATARPSTHWTTAGADGTALRSAGSIAGKLR